MEFKSICPECGSSVRRCPEIDFGKEFKGYKCVNGHVITVFQDREVISVKIPFKHLEFCPKCGRRLKAVSTMTYDEEEGLVKLVTYRCETGHWIPHRQLVFRRYGRPSVKLGIKVDDS